METHQQLLGNSCRFLSDMKTPIWCLWKTSPLHVFLLFQWSQNQTTVRSQPKIYSPRGYGSSTSADSSRKYFGFDHTAIVACGISGFLCRVLWGIETLYYQGLCFQEDDFTLNRFKSSDIQAVFIRLWKKTTVFVSFNNLNKLDLYYFLSLILRHFSILNCFCEFFFYLTRYKILILLCIQYCCVSVTNFMHWLILSISFLYMIFKIAPFFDSAVHIDLPRTVLENHYFPGHGHLYLICILYSLC